MKTLFVAIILAIVLTACATTQMTKVLWFDNPALKGKSIQMGLGEDGNLKWRQVIAEPGEKEMAPEEKTKEGSMEEKK